MSVRVLVKAYTDHPLITSDVAKYDNVIGHVLAMVVKDPDGAITLERDIAVNADNAEENSLAESVVKTIERKLNEAFPDPKQAQEVPEAKLWVPE